MLPRRASAQSPFPLKATTTEEGRREQAVAAVGDFRDEEDAGDRGKAEKYEEEPRPKIE